MHKTIYFLKCLGVLHNISTDLPHDTDFPYFIRIIDDLRVIRPYHILIRNWFKYTENPGQGILTASKMTDGPRVSPVGDHMTRKDDKGDQPSDGETTWTNTGATRYGRGKHKTG